MTASSAEASLPAIELVARNTAAESSNKIHDDAEARRYGYGGGLVPGVTLYAYLTQLAVGFYGPAWLEHGTADCSFRRPVYEGETVRCEGETVSGAATDSHLDLRALREGVLCAGGTFGLPLAQLDARVPALPDVPLAPARPAEPLPELRPDTVPLGVPLAPLHTVIMVEQAAAYADETDDPNPWYRGPSPFGGPLVPPGWLAARQASLLRLNFRFGPSIHARTVMQHLAPAFAGRAYTTAATIRDTFERSGNHYLVLDAITHDDQDRAVCRVEHTSIFSVRQVSPTD